MKFTVAVTHEAPWYVARSLDVDVVSQGETVDSAVENLEETLSLYVEGEDFRDSLEPPIITIVPTHRALARGTVGNSSTVRDYREPIHRLVVGSAVS